MSRYNPQFKLPLPVATPYCSANFSETLTNTWISPNSPTPPFPGPDLPSLNIRRHASWWDSSAPWLPYIPVFGLHANVHHEFFSISKTGIIFVDLVTNTWMIDPVRLSQWQEFFFVVHDICCELRRYLLNCLDWECYSLPPNVNYKDLLPLRFDSASDMSNVLMETHDILLEWIGYFNWLCIMFDSLNISSVLSETLKTPSISAFCLYLSKFSNRLRGVCVDFGAGSISEELVQQWVRFHVPCYIILSKAGIDVQKVPSQYTIRSMAARKRSPHLIKRRHYAIEEQGQFLKVWEPPKRIRRDGTNRRYQYFQTFYSSDFDLPDGPVRIYWYKVR
jgi:hypothetical protein